MEYGCSSMLDLSEDELAPCSSEALDEEVLALGEDHSGRERSPAFPLPLLKAPEVSHISHNVTAAV